MASPRCQRGLMDQLPALEMISVMGVGYDGVEVRRGARSAARGDQHA